MQIFRTQRSLHRGWSATCLRESESHTKREIKRQISLEMEGNTERTTDSELVSTSLQQHPRIVRGIHEETEMTENQKQELSIVDQPHFATWIANCEPEHLDALILSGRVSLKDLVKIRSDIQLQQERFGGLTDTQMQILESVTDLLEGKVDRIGDLRNGLVTKEAALRDKIQEICLFRAKIDDLIREAVANSPGLKIKGDVHEFRLQKNGGVQPIEIPDPLKVPDSHCIYEMTIKRKIPASDKALLEWWMAIALMVEQLPAEEQLSPYQIDQLNREFVREPDNKAIRESLAAGETVEGVMVADRGYHMRAKPNLVKEIEDALKGRVKAADEALLMLADGGEA